MPCLYVGWEHLLGSMEWGKIMHCWFDPVNLMFFDVKDHLSIYLIHLDSLALQFKNTKPLQLAPSKQTRPKATVIFNLLRGVCGCWGGGILPLDSLQPNIMGLRGIVQMWFEKEDGFASLWFHVLFLYLPEEVDVVICVGECGTQS